jgi:ABC-type antimicrobial peptide transport system permease subunit
VAGRSFTKSDDKNSPRVAIVNREFARKLFGSEIAAIGRHFKIPDGTRVEVVGIAEDGKYGSLTEDPHVSMFLPLTQWPAGPQWMVIRSSRDPQQLGEEIRRAFHQVDAGIPVEVEKRSDELVTVLFGPEMATIALGVLGCIGVILPITGIFGMAAYSVSKRLKELGIRVALGARRKEVLGVAFGRAVKLLAIGSAAGLGLGILATRVLAFIVYQATPRDPLVLAGVVAAMAVLGLVATWIPAQRALSVDPVVLLREE